MIVEWAGEYITEFKTRKSNFSCMTESENYKLIIFFRETKDTDTVNCNSILTGCTVTYVKDFQETTRASSRKYIPITVGLK